MSELDEIMDGKHELNHLRIEGDTIAFDTELNNHTWNLSPRDIEIIIYCLQRELKELQDRIDKAIEYIESQKPSDIGICGNEKKYYYTLGEDNVDRLLEILKGENKE